MQQRDGWLLALIIVLTALAVWVALPSNQGVHQTILGVKIDKDIKIYQGLDLQGGMQVLLEADLPANQAIDAEAMASARRIVESRVNGLGVAEPVVQSVGGRRVLVELPGIKNPEAAVATLQQTGLMEWVDTGTQRFPDGITITTDFATSAVTTTGSVTATIPTATQPITGTAPLTTTTVVTAIAPLTSTTPAESRSPEKVYHTVLTGRNLKRVQLEFSSTGQPEIGFELDAEGATTFADFTSRNVGRILCIVLDKKTISCPSINSAITEGRGVIQGGFDVPHAQAMVLQLRYGSLPVPLKVVDTRSVGPTLGQDSVQKSVRAGTIGLVIVLLFMLIYYRLLGLLADLALIIYALVTLSVFKLLPVTMTLPGIAGFLVSLGMAVDANILIFERMREELRQGRSLDRAVDAGFRRAWTSILDSNISTWITCAILFAFGSSFGASVVKGFAVTLALGVLVSIFTAVTVSRTFVRTAFAIGGERLAALKWLLSI